MYIYKILLYILIIYLLILTFIKFVVLPAVGTLAPQMSHRASLLVHGWK